MSSFRRDLTLSKRHLHPRFRLGDHPQAFAPRQDRVREAATFGSDWLAYLLPLDSFRVVGPMARPRSAMPVSLAKSFALAAMIKRINVVAGFAGNPVSQNGRLNPAQTTPDSTTRSK